MDENHELRQKFIQESPVFCICCGRKIGWMKYLHSSKDNLRVKAMDRGREVTVQACSRKCRERAWKRFERKKRWLEVQQMELRNAKRVMESMSKALTNMCREASRLQQEVSKQHETSDN